MDLSSLENIKTFGENPSLKNCNIRYLINNAGFAKFCSYDDISIDESINMIDLNISGVVAMGLVCKMCIRDRYTVYHPYIADFGSHKAVPCIHVP